MSATLPLAPPGPAELQPPIPDPGAGSKLPPLHCDTSDLCQLLRISKATLHRLLAAGKLPRPIRLAGLKWAAAHIKAFVAPGCPDRAVFEARREADSARGRH
jgi:predicted DNA-binding transcriptional regulator AlpA